MEDAPSGVVAHAQPLGAEIFVDDCMNDDLIEKLRLLNYETDFCRNFNPQQTFKPLTRTFFTATAENANAQFFYFTSLTTWLLQLCGNKNVTPPGQFDDPTAVVSNLLQEIKTVDIPVKDFAPNKIKSVQGSGWSETVLPLMLMLADRALISRRFSFRPIEYPKADTTVTAPQEGGGAGAIAGSGGNKDNNNTDEIEDRVGDVAHSDSDADGAEEEQLFSGIYGAGRRGAAALQAPTQPQVPAEVWNLEVERVAPMLQNVAFGNEIRDWRARVEGAVTLMRAVDTMYPEVRAMLERVGDDIDKSLDRIRKREQTLGQQFAEQVEDYRGKLRRLNALQDTFNGVSTKVSGFSSELNNVTAALEDVKARIQEIEEKSSDTTPLVRIKEAVAKVRAEIKEMSLRIGVLQHTVLHYALRQQKERKGKQAQGIAAAANLHGGRGSDGGRNSDGTFSSPEHGAGGNSDLDFSGYM